MTGPYRAGTPITLEAAGVGGAQSGGALRRVEFFAGDRKIGESAAAPHRFVWRNAPAGFHRVSARATTAPGATTTSSPLNMDVVP
jgi:hypothetical protein